MGSNPIEGSRRLSLSNYIMKEKGLYGKAKV